MEKNYVEYYIEILTSTMNDAIVRNISLQANAKITDVAIGQLNEKILELEAEIEKYQSNNNSTIDDYNNKINGYENRINDINNNHSQRINELNSEIAKLHQMKAEYENVKSQATHVDTFRNELLKARQENESMRNEYESKIKELNDKIEYLQLTPAKRKKIDDLNKPSEPMGLDALVKDGGSF